MGAVFTLSGIAALVLGVGMAVDSNILTFERIKESMYAGRSVKTAFREGSKDSFRTIVDAQLTTFISALILYIFGTGSVKGFATMLIVSTITTLLLIVFIVRFLLGLLVNSGYLDERYELFGVKKSDVPDVAKGEERRKFSKFKGFDFVGKAKYFVCTSLAVLVISIVCIGVNGFSGNGVMNLGIDFTSGTTLTIQSDAAIDQDTLESQLEELGLDPSSVKINGSESNIASVYLKDAVDADEHRQGKPAGDVWS